MDYEKKYKEALEKVRELLSRCIDNRDRRTNIYCAEDIESIFPELKKSEDERIRKELIQLISCMHDADPRKKGWITWLEKQGGKPKEVTCTHEVGTGNGNIKALVTEKIQLPKFHEGDWIISNDKKSTYQVIKVKRGIYVIRDNADNHEYHIGIEECEKSGRLFTIQDAKDGDVLVVPPVKGSEHTEQIFIFKEIKDREYVKSAVEYYCRVIDNEFCVNERGFMGQSDDYFVPATKEQRDTLFAKMHEAGFEWDAEKKELKKISQRMISAEAKEAMYGKPTAWSEKDEQRVENLLAIIERHGYPGEVAWLKSIKQRMG